MLLECKRILGRLGVRRPVIGKVINLLPEEAEHVSPLLFPAFPLILATVPSVPALNRVMLTSS